MATPPVLSKIKLPTNVDSFPPPELKQIPLVEIHEHESHEFAGDGFYSTQMQVRDNIKQIRKHAKLITFYTNEYKQASTGHAIQDINNKINSIISANNNLSTKIQQMIKSELAEISVVSPVSKRSKIDRHCNRPKGETLNALIRSFKKAIQMYYISLSVYNQCVYDKQMRQLAFLNDDFTNNDIEKLLTFDAQQRQQFIHEKMQNHARTNETNDGNDHDNKSQIRALQRIENIKYQRHEMQKVNESVNAMKKLDHTLHELAIDLPSEHKKSGSSSSASSKRNKKMKLQQLGHTHVADLSMDDLDDIDDDDEQLGVSGGILADFKQSQRGKKGRRKKKKDEFDVVPTSPFTAKQVAQGRVVLHVNEHDVDGEHGEEVSEEERKRKRCRRGCKIWCLVLVLVAFVVSFAALDIVLNDRWF